MKIVTTTQVQQNIWILSDTNNMYTVINRWEPKTLVIPYSEEALDMLEDYLEDLEIMRNSDNLQKEMQASVDSGISHFKI